MIAPHRRDRRQRGFTLVELMVALMLSLIVAGGIYKGFVSFSVAADVQEQLVELQQNMRIGMGTMTRELRMAGLDQEGTANAGFVSATTNKVRFTYDYDDNGAIDPGDDVTFTLSDVDGDGVNDLFRTTNNALPAAANQFIANVDALNFVYLDENGTALANPVTGVSLTNIRSVQVTMVARSTNPDYSITDNQPYTNLTPTVIYTPAGSARNFRRRGLSAHVNCRNMGP